MNRDEADAGRDAPPVPSDPRGHATMNWVHGSQSSVIEDTPATAHATNELAGTSSAYLRSAMHQPVAWMPWSEAAFERAAREDKPILLDIGAVWCHWCHVMDRESYEDHTTAHIINDHFIAIKVDRDERPDVDSRYQAAISAISGQGGWPLTAFLTPHGKPYFGGTYFPLEDRHGQPSFQRVLLTMAEAFAARRDEVEESAVSVMQAIEQNEMLSGRSDDPASSLLQMLVASILKTSDPRHGGFGSQPKFPHAGAIDLLIDVAARGDSASITLPGHGVGTVAESARRVVLTTLEKMARGGIYDHLAGGFHRYSVDERWIVPHFEKMAYDNCQLLKNYVHAFQTFADPACALVAQDIIRWMDACLADREAGGFYASQDADFSLHDDGDYFTWTYDEVAELLSPRELQVASLYYDIGEIGDMHHNVAKNVLHVKHEIEVVARRSGVTLFEAETLLAAARRKLLTARVARPTPYVDRTIYVGWNALCISAYLDAGRVLKLADAKVFAIKSLDRLLAIAWDGSGRGHLRHVVAYGDASAAGSADPSAAIDSGLDDYVLLGHAALDAWEATGELRYYQAASEIMESTLAQFYDIMGCGFFDTPVPMPGEHRLGALEARRKPLQDSPTPAGNPLAAALLMRLDALSGNHVYGSRARETLETFAGVVEHLGLYAATYALALQHMVQRPIQVCIVGRDRLARELEQAALARYAVNKSVVRFDRDQLATLPPALAETLPHLAGLPGSFAIVCTGKTCQPPVQTADELTALLQITLR